jgi:hypothetical protein
MGAKYVGAKKGTFNGAPQPSRAGRRCNLVPPHFNRRLSRGLAVNAIEPVAAQVTLAVSAVELRDCFRRVESVRDRARKLKAVHDRGLLDRRSEGRNTTRGHYFSFAKES